ncbi:MAG: ATP-binding protein [Candidatus Binatia bacterium]
MSIKCWHALSLRGKVISAIIVLQFAMIAILVSVQTYHELLLVREYMRDVNIQFTRNLAHSLAPIVHLKNLSLLNQYVDLAIAEEDISYVVVESSYGDLLAARSKDSAASSLPQEGETERLPNPTAVRQTGEPRGWLATFSPVTYESSVPITVMGQEAGLVRVGVSTRRLDQKVWAGALRGLLMAGLALGLVVLFAFFVDRRLKGIFRELMAVTRKMAEGDLTRRVNINTGDELQELGHAFNRMADSLASSQQLLQGWARDLEMKVKERTQALEEEKRKLDMIVSGIGAALVLLNRDLRVLWANRIATECFGPLHQFQGGKCFVALLGETDLCQECAAVKTLRSGSVEHVEKVVLGRNGKRRFFQVTTSPIKNGQGEIVQLLELIQDVTEKKQLEAQLLQAGKMVAMGELASGIAHQINNPLAVIAANAERMANLSSRSHVPAEKRYEKFPSYLEAILRHTYRCKEIIEKLLNFARHKEVDLQPTDINVALEDSVALVIHRASMENKKIIKHLSPALPVIQSDFSALEQVFLNILTNALDAIDERGEIHITSRVEAGFVRVEIADTGSGIPVENLDRIFQPFFTTKPPGRGTGLGLSICARIVNRLGGQITVQSTPGKGTCFCAALPIEGSHVIRIQESNLWKNA